MSKGDRLGEEEGAGSGVEARKEERATRQGKGGKSK